MVDGISNVAAVSAGTIHSLAIGSDGTVWAWGCNSGGRLGDGTFITRTLPVQAIGITKAMAVAAGGNHSVALLEDGTVMAWGNNNFGQLGDGNNSLRPIPEAVNTLENIISISAGHSHTLALQEDGTIWAWGLNMHGQLGDGTTIDGNVPVRVIMRDILSVNNPCAYTNLALNTQGAVMIASSSQGVRTADRANNGVREGAATDSWSAAGVNQEWLMVDLGEQRNFNTVRIFQGGSRIMDYRFEHSNDEVNWTVFHSSPNRMLPATPAFYEVEIMFAQARFIRLVSERSSGAAIVVFEFEVYFIN